MLLEKLSRNWWSVVLRGVVAVIFGVIAIARPGLTVGALVLFFGVYTLFDGILALAAAFMGGSGTPWCPGKLGNGMSRGDR